MIVIFTLESRRRRTKGSVVGEEWCQNAAPLRWYTKNVFAQSKMILSRAWLHDTVSCAAWNDARKGVYLKPLFQTPCSNCYWGWSIPIMLDYRDISLMESVPVMWGPVTASPVGIEPMTIFGGGPLIIDIQYITARIPWIPWAGPPNTPLSLCWSTENSGSWRYLSWLNHHSCLISAKRFHQGMSMVNVFCPSIPTIQVHLRLLCLAAAKGSLANEPSRTSHVSRLWIIDPKLSKPDLSESIIDRLCDI